MERLTFEGDFCDIAQCREMPCPYNNSCTQREVWERLKAYEDSGVSPKACAQALEMENLLADEYYSVNRMLELLKADKEGRVVVLPFKMGGMAIYQDFAENSTLMKNTRLEIAYESRCGVIFRMGYGLFVDLVEHGRIKPVSEEAEEALRRFDNG